MDALTPPARMKCMSEYARGPALLRKHLALALAAATVTLLACVPAGLAARESGVSGSVEVSPAHPGPQRADEAGSRPLSDAELQLRDARGRIVARGNADSKGIFRVLAPAGQYVLEVNTHGALYPRCESESVQVTEAQLTRVDIVCDSGMR